MRECLACREKCRWSALLCLKCEHDFMRALHPRSSPPADVDGVPLLSLARYEGSLARVLKVAKAQPGGFLESNLESLLESLVRHWTEEITELGCTAVVGIPSHPLRRVLQTDLSRLLAEHVAESAELPCYPRALEWTAHPFALFRRASHQKNRTRAERLGATARFRVQRTRVPHLPARILLVDDVCATGATLRDGKRRLEEAGFEVGAALVLARSEGK
jgi:predicted amidophosphoribosyltransferase